MVRRLVPIPCVWACSGGKPVLGQQLDRIGRAQHVGQRSRVEQEGTLDVASGEKGRPYVEVGPFDNSDTHWSR